MGRARKAHARNWSLATHSIAILAGWLATWLIGLSLGLVGGGGSILTVPILVYLFGIAATQATGYSLFIVGTTSLAGSVAHAAWGNVSGLVAATFAGPSLVAVYLVRRWVVPALPAVFALPGGFGVPRDVALMLGFAIVMAVVAALMIRSRPIATQPHAPQWGRLAVLGVGVGALAGLFGVGGGFLIVPALVLVAGLTMPIAVGTSLAVIAVQSLAGFVGVVQTAERIDWPLLGALTALAVVGMGAGLALGRRVQAARLKAAFGWFVLAMSVVIAGAEIAAWSAVAG